MTTRSRPSVARLATALAASAAVMAAANLTPTVAAPLQAAPSAVAPALAVADAPSLGGVVTAATSATSNVAISDDKVELPLDDPPLVGLTPGSTDTASFSGATLDMGLAAEPVTVTLLGAPFVDVDAGTPFYDDILWLAASGISTGTALGGGRYAFQPGDPVLRQEMAAFLYRAAGRPSFTAPAASPFVDVATGAPFYKEIAWLAAAGISTGTSLGGGRYTFQPGDPVLRQEMAAFLYRAAGRPSFTAPAASPFVDVATGAPFYKEIAWLAAAGISTGTSLGGGRYAFEPGVPVSRQAMAAFLHRASQSAPPKPDSERGGPSNTGVPVGTVLKPLNPGDPPPAGTRWSGNVLMVTTAGTVLDSYDIRALVRVEAKDVVIKNSRITGQYLSSSFALLYISGGSYSVTVRDCELFAQYPSPYVRGVIGYNFTLERVDIHDVIDQMAITGDNVTVKDSWLHSNLYYLEDPVYNNTPSHDDNAQIQKGSNLTFINNTMEGTRNAAIQVTQDAGVVSDVLIEGNYISDGGCALNLAQKSRGPLQGFIIKNNVFTRTQVHVGCAIIVDAPSIPLLTLANNTWADGTAVTVTRR